MLKIAMKRPKFSPKLFDIFETPNPKISNFSKILALKYDFCA